MADNEKRAGPAPGILALVFLALTLALSIFRFLDGDEVEHVHSAWHVLNGAVPYVDFFEHHHPLLWYLLAPVLAIAGESAGTIVVLRLGFFLLVPAAAWATYRLARECGGGHDAAWLSVFLLLSMTTFVYVAIEIRPDVPQTLFGVVSAIFLARTLRTRRARDAVLAGLFAAVAFLFLQKAALLIALYPVPFVAAAARRRVPWRLGVYGAGAFIAGCVPFAAYLVWSGSLNDYVVTNWLLNARVGAGRSAVSFLNEWVLRDFARNGVFWVLSLAMAGAAVRRRPAAPFTLPAWLGWGLVAVVAVLNRVVDRYIVAAVPFLAVAVGLWLADEAARRQIRGVRLTALLLVVCLVPGVAMARAVFRTNRGQLDEDPVRARSLPGRRPDARRVARLQRVPARHALLLVHDQAGRAPVQQLHRRPAGRLRSVPAHRGRQAPVRFRPHGSAGAVRAGRAVPAYALRSPDGTRSGLSRIYFFSGSGAGGAAGGRSLLIIWYSNFHCVPSLRRIQMTFPRSCRSGPPAGLRFRLNVPAK